MNGCKICGQQPAESYRKVARPETAFTCGQCLQDGAEIGSAYKKDLERLYAKCAFIAEVWDEGNTRATYLMDLARKRLDPRLCIRIRGQVSDLKLRHRWMDARITGGKLPKVAPAVQWHFEREFQKSYPQGVSDINYDLPQT